MKLSFEKEELEHFWKPKNVPNKHIHEVIIINISDVEVVDLNAEYPELM